MKKDIILEFEDVTKFYGNELVFNNVNIKIKKGDVIALTGKSGCGKSTLLKCINRLEKIDNGTIKFKGLDIYEISTVELRQKIGIVFQDYNLFQHLTVLDNLIIGLTKIKKYSKEKSARKALNILKKVGLADKKDKYPDDLSGGQKQRVAIARTLLMEPDIILLDESKSTYFKFLNNINLEELEERAEQYLYEKQYYLSLLDYFGIYIKSQKNKKIID